jgi:crotonobetainyl-CoA:carnitine CoA-transferase CaiB-like acyl-CoA transferase
MALPLEGVKVVSVEQSVSGPLCTALLSDFGAEVIKIERPRVGDVAREWDTAARGLSSAFVSLNRNKKSFTLDMKSPRGFEIFKQLIRTADVFVHNLTPEAISRLKLEYESLRAINPTLVFCGISGYGKDGPYSHAKAYDLLVQGEAALITLTGYPDKPAKIALSICDIAAGMYASEAILLAIIHRQKTGEGQEIDISMFESVISWYIYFQYYAWYRGETPARSGMRHHIFSPYGPFLAADGRYVNFAVLSNVEWKRVTSQVFMRDDLLHDPRFETNEKRVKNRSELEPIVEQIISTRDHNYWIRELEKAGIACGRLNTLTEVFDHPQSIYRKIVSEIDTPVGKVKFLSSPMRLSKTPARAEFVPALGSHTDVILAALGLSKASIDSLRSEGVV